MAYTKVPPEPKLEKPGFTRQIRMLNQGTIDGFGTWTLDENGLLTIDGKGEMPEWEFEKINGEWGPTTPWRYVREMIKTVRIVEGITSIRDWSFTDCHSLTSITIPDTVTGIGDYAFSWCRSLTSIMIPDSVTSIGKSAFSWCSSLTIIRIPSSVTSIGGNAFKCCSSLEQVIMPIKFHRRSGFEEYYGIPKRIASFSNPYR